MLGYDYVIIYKKGKYNVVADALLRKYEDEGSLLALSPPISEWLEEAHYEWLAHDSTAQLIKGLHEDPNPP